MTNAILYNSKYLHEEVLVQLLRNHDTGEVLTKEVMQINHDATPIGRLEMNTIVSRLVKDKAIFKTTKVLK